MILACVMLGAALGAPLRWLTDRMVQQRNDSVFPWGTFTVNVVGSFLLGAIAAVFAQDSLWYAALGTGFCGGFTTFSTFSYENVRLLEESAPRIAGRNVVASVGAGLVAVYLGWLLGSAAT